MQDLDFNIKEKSVKTDFEVIKKAIENNESAIQDEKNTSLELEERVDQNEEDISEIAPAKTRGYSNLKIAYATASTVTVSWDSMYIESKDLGALSSTILDITASGLGGLDASSIETVSTWYYVYATAKSDFSEKGVILSSNATAPDLAGTGHTKYRKVGWAYNDSSNDIRIFSQQDNKHHYERLTVINAGTATTPTTVSVAPYIPPDSHRFYASIRLIGTSGSGLLLGYVNNSYYVQIHTTHVSSGGLHQTQDTNPINTFNQNVQYYKASAITDVDIWCFGFEGDL